MSNKRVIVQVPEYLHTKIKIECAKRKTSINQFVVLAILHRMSYQISKDPIKDQPL